MQPHHPVTLAASPERWRLFALRKADPKFEQFATKIWQRDHYTCQFCGFQAQQFQEVLNLDQNYRNNKLSNLVTACCFCTQCFFLDAVGLSDYGGGVLIYLPNMPQNALSGMCHVLFCAMANATNYRTDAQNIYRSFKLRTQLVEKEFGEGMSDPAKLAAVLIDANVKERAQLMQNVYKDLRLLPLQAKFRTQIQTWAQAALDEMKSKD